jgi:hypothetical protein
MQLLRTVVCVLPFVNNCIPNNSVGRIPALRIGQPLHQPINPLILSKSIADGKVSAAQVLVQEKDAVAPTIPISKPETNQNYIFESPKVNIPPNMERLTTSTVMETINYLDQRLQQSLNDMNFNSFVSFAWFLIPHLTEKDFPSSSKTIIRKFIQHWAATIAAKGKQSQISSIINDEAFCKSIGCGEIMIQAILKRGDDRSLELLLSKSLISGMDAVANLRKLLSLLQHSSPTSRDSKLLGVFYSHSEKWKFDATVYDHAATLDVALTCRDSKLVHDILTVDSQVLRTYFRHRIVSGDFETKPNALHHAFITTNQMKFLLDCLMSSKIDVVRMVGGIQVLAQSFTDASSNLLLQYPQIKKRMNRDLVEQIFEANTKTVSKNVPEFLQMKLNTGFISRSLSQKWGGDGNQYPIVMVHGMFGWGELSMQNGQFVFFQ